MKMKSYFRSGIISQYDGRRKIGHIIVPEEPIPIQFSLGSLRAIIAGVNKPEFGRVPPESGPMPCVGGQVVVAFEVSFNPVKGEGYRGLRRFARSTAWDFLFRFKDAQKEITERPIYEVREFELYKGDPISQGSEGGKVIITGTVKQIQQVFPRSVSAADSNDPLSPEVTMMDLTYRRRFFLKGSKGWEQLNIDPRPLPEGAIAIADKLVLVNNRGELIANDEKLHALAALVNGRRAGTGTPRPGELATV